MLKATPSRSPKLPPRLKSRAHNHVPGRWRLRSGLLTPQAQPHLSWLRGNGLVKSRLLSSPCLCAPSRRVPQVASTSATAQRMQSRSSSWPKAVHHHQERARPPPPSVAASWSKASGQQGARLVARPARMAPSQMLSAQAHTRRRVRTLHLLPHRRSHVPPLHLHQARQPLRRSRLHQLVPAPSQRPQGRWYADQRSAGGRDCLSPLR